MDKDTIKVGEELGDLVSKITEAQGYIDEARVIYEQVFVELVNEYDGDAIDKLISYYSILKPHLANMSETYGKVGTYISYVYDKMNEVDVELASYVEDALSQYYDAGEAD